MARETRKVYILTLHFNVQIKLYVPWKKKFNVTLKKLCSGRDFFFQIKLVVISTVHQSLKILRLGFTPPQGILDGSSTMGTSWRSPWGINEKDSPCVEDEEKPFWEIPRVMSPG